jgi:hypothetical protein
MKEKPVKFNSEYTSRAWDVRLSPGLPDFVADTYSTFKNAGIVFP